MTPDSDNGSNHRSLRRLSHIVWRVVRPALIIYLSVVLVMSLLETWIVYPAPPVAWGNWQPANLQHEDVWFESADGTRLFGWFVPHEQPRMVLLYCHGNGEHIGQNVELAALLRDKLAASVFLFDYRGYGRSEGSPYEAGLIADGLAAQRWLAKRTGVAPQEVVLMGRSLGGGVAVALAAEQGARALVLENTYPRMVDVAAMHYWWLPVRLLMRNRYDSVARMRHYDGPVFQSHGTADEIVPLELGRQLHESIASEQKQFVELPDIGHNDPPPAAYYDRLRAFLDEVLSDETPSGL